MTPFQEFRLWARRAPANERLFAAIATAIVLVLLVWVLIPSSNGNSSLSAFPGSSTPSGAPAGTTAGTTPGSTSGTTSGALPGASGGSGGTTAGSIGTTGTGAAAGSGATASGGNSTTGAKTGTTTSQGSGGCQSPPASGQGVTDKTIKIAVALTQIIGPVGNATFNVASPQLQQDAYQAAIDDVNASGGVACRKLVP